MGSPTLAVSSAIDQFTPSGMHLSVGAQRALPMFNFLHRIWSYWRRGKLYANHFGKMMAGHALNAVAGDNRWLQIAAQCVLIAQRILTCVEQQVKVWRSCHKLSDAFFNRYPSAITRKWSKQSSAFLSPSSARWWLEFFIAVYMYLKILIWRILRLIYHFFKLSMVTMDAIEAFSFSPEKCHEAITELFVNSSDCVDKSARNGQRILDMLKEHKPIVESVFSSLGSSWSVDHIIESAGQRVNSLHEVNQSVQTFGSTVESVIGDIGKNSLFGLTSAFGMSRLVPDSLLPPVAPAAPLMVAPIGKVFGRFAPVFSIGIKDKAEAILKDHDIDITKLPVAKNPIKGMRFKPTSLEKIYAKKLASSKPQKGTVSVVMPDQPGIYDSEIATLNLDGVH